MIIRNTLYLFIVFLAFFCPRHSFAQELKQGFYASGKLRYEGNFVGGKPDGMVIHYYEDGAIKAKMNHLGDTVEAVLYSRSGEYTSSGKYFRKAKCGKWFYYKNRGIVGTDEYQNNRLEGESVRYSTDKRMIERKCWKGGKANGGWELYYENGQKRLQAFYAEGKLNGEIQSFSRDGVLRTKGMYKNNLKEGEWEFYDETGTLVLKRIYHQGVLENAEEEELKQSRELDTLLNTGKRIPDPEIFADDPETYMRLTDGQ